MLKQPPEVSLSKYFRRQKLKSAYRKVTSPHYPVKDCVACCSPSHSSHHSKTRISFSKSQGQNDGEDDKP